MYMPCQHGIGHGILVYTDYTNLVDALKLCETVSTLPTGGCSSGVFMENNFHTMDASADTAHLRTAGDNLYAPCDTLPERFQASCYLEQVQWWQTLFKNNFKHIGELCGAIKKSGDVMDACYHGIGNYLAASVALNPKKIIIGCRDMPSEKTQALCHEGASWLVRGDGLGIENAKEICSALPVDYARACLRTLE